MVVWVWFPTVLTIRFCTTINTLYSSFTTTSEIALYLVLVLRALFFVVPFILFTLPHIFFFSPLVSSRWRDKLPGWKRSGMGGERGQNWAGRWISSVSLHTPNRSSQGAEYHHPVLVPGLILAIGHKPRDMNKTLTARRGHFLLM